ncbi:MAG: phosphate acyltransferase PlsX [Clostridia bacterium]|nr:phosphate acyltransferase PlsX [Clostridia bacterium]
MKIIVDAMSGDNAPQAQLEGVARAAEDYGTTDFAVVGNRQEITDFARRQNINIFRNNVELIHSISVISMEDHALSVVREKRDSSMSVGLKMLADGEGDAFVSSGNTGALHAGSTLIVRRIKGIQKSAIASVLPYRNPTLLIDSGANIEIPPETYVQFARMGTVYMRSMFGLELPRVGLVNIGTERTKGSKLLQDAYSLLEQEEAINFIGNVEGKDLPFGVCDVLVCDGFTGNIVLKLTEGCGSYFMSKLKDIYEKNPVARMSSLTVKTGLRRMKKDFDASEYGGAPLLGLSKPVIKAHGGSDSKAVYNAVRQAINCVSSNVTYSIAGIVMKNQGQEEATDGK